MNKSFLWAAVMFVCTAFSLEAYENFKGAYQAAQAAYKSGRYDDALKCCEEAVSLAKSPKEQYSALNYAADVCWKKNDLDGLQKQLNLIINNEKMDVNQRTQALLKKANFLRWKGKKAEALPVFKKAMEQKPSKNIRHNLLINYADFLITVNKLSEAEAVLKEAAEIENPNIRYAQHTKYQTARLKAAQKKYAEATKLYQELLDVPDLFPWMKANIYRGIVGRVHLPQKKFKEAHQALDSLAQDDSIPAQNKKWIEEVRASIYLENARAAASQKKYEEAQELYRKTIASAKAPYWIKNGAYSDLFYRVYRPQNKTEEGLKLLDEAEKDPTIPQKNKEWISTAKLDARYLAPARRLIHEKKFDQAAEALKSVPVEDLSRKTKQMYYDLLSELEFGRAVVLRRQKDIKAALQSFLKAAEIDQASIACRDRAYAEAVWLHLQLKNLDEAKAIIDILTSEKNLPDNRKIRNQLLLARYYLTCQQVNDAIEALEKGLEIRGKADPNFVAQCYERLSSIYLYHKKDLDKAEEYHKKAQDLPKASWGKDKNLDKQLKKAREKQQNN